MRIPGSVSDRQRAQRDSDEVHNDSRNLATIKAILRNEGVDNSGSEEHCNRYLYFAVQKEHGESLDDK